MKLLPALADCADGRLADYGTVGAISCKASVSNQYPMVQLAQFTSRFYAEFLGEYLATVAVNLQRRCLVSATVAGQH